MFIRVVEQPTIAPAQCKMCSASTLSEREYWLDTGTMEEFYGAVYYCNTCIEEIGSLCGFLPPKAATRLKERLENAKREIRDLKACIGALSDIGVDVSAIDRFIKNHPSAVGEDEGELEGLVAGAATIAEQVAKQGPDDVSDSPKRKIVL